MFVFLRRLSARFIRPRGPEAGALRLTRKRIYILPTRAGLLYAVVLITMFVGAINYDLALGHALVFLLASLALVSMVHTHKNLQNLSLRTQEAPPVHAGEMACFHFLAHAPEARPALEWSEARIDAALSSAPPPSPQILHLSADTETHLYLNIATQKRGWLPLPRLLVRTRYPLGLFYAWAYPWPQARCLVYPRAMFSPLPPGQPSGAGGAGPSKEGEEDFAGLRERQNADSPRHIAWKAAARDGGEKPLLVKLFAGGAQEELWLNWVDTERLADDVETRLSFLTGWVLGAEDAGCTYGLRLPDARLAPARGPVHRRRCLEALALTALADEPACAGRREAAP
ncbi:MAG: DUF58 domain-containing protein [Zoogloeaceae bacterium]|jgi:uncharacterized protein (DUF58 family)|nr:DUF58 domain-containing protein [Zoogloeaceae bacterium]